MGKPSDNFTRLRHMQYFVRCLAKLPPRHAALDTNRLTMVHFAVQSLDMLGFFDTPENLETYSVRKDEIIEWIYNLQTDPFPKAPGTAGFKGGSFLGPHYKNVHEDEDCGCYCYGYYNQGHLAMTYSALCTLITLGDDLKRVHRHEIVAGLKFLQQKDGSFRCLDHGSECDLRFVYCACAISYILKDWTGVDKHAAIQYIQSCRTFDGALSLVPCQESHGGSTFCGIASLALMGELDRVLECNPGWKQDLIRWCVSRQIKGMQGRPNKLEDTCYSYWIGGTLEILGYGNLLDKNALNEYVMECQTDLGGFSKVREDAYYPDLLHSFYSLAWLSISEEEGPEKRYDLYPIDAMLGMSKRRFDAYSSC